MNVNIVHSGSSGNCAVIDETIVIDAGWKYEGKARCVFLTHAHSDHTKQLESFGGLPVYATAETANKLIGGKFPYMVFNELRPQSIDRIQIKGTEHTYYIKPILVKHDAPCVGFDIIRYDDNGEDSRIFFATDFNSIVDEVLFIRNLRDKVYDAVYIECNNTLDCLSFLEVFFSEDGTEPKDEFHRRKSWENHCNVSYLQSLFERAGYGEHNKFTEPVTLLHKSSFYYLNNVDKLVGLASIANVTNIMYP